MSFRIVRAAIVTLSLLVCLSASAPPASPAKLPVLARYLPEVRLRKLYLVRPDLIGYPIYYEVLC